MNRSRRYLAVLSAAALLLTGGAALRASGAAGDLPPALAQALVAHVAGTFDVPAGAVVVTVVRPPRIDGAAGADLRYAVQPQRDGELGYQVVWVEPYRGSERLARTTMAVHLAVRRRIAVAATELRRGERLEPEAIRIEEREIRDAAMLEQADPGALAGLEARHYVAEGTPLAGELFRNPPAVRRGERVSIELIRGSLLIRDSGIAREDAAIGETILVSCESTGKRLRGTVQSPRHVMITRR